MNIIKSIKNLTKGEKILWISSLAAVAASFLIAGKQDFLSLTASLIGVTALIFIAKGDALGEIIFVIFSLIYAVISYNFNYYGEMLTFLLMAIPCSIAAAITWLKHPYGDGKTQVEIRCISKKETAFMFLITAAVTVVFYFILRYFDTANLIVSTISVGTSFAAAYLQFRRSHYYAVAYTLNDLILIVLWLLAAVADISYLPMVVCFAVFAINDVYGFYNWLKMKKQQAKVKNI